MDGTIVLEIWRSSSIVDGAGSRGSGGGGGATAGGAAVTVVAVDVAAAANSGAETLSLGSSVGAQLQPKIVHPQFSS